MEIQIKVDDNGLGRKFGLAAKQTKFALAYGINETLKHSQQKQISFMERTYTIRRRNLLKASVRMLKFAKASDLRGEVGIHRELMRVWGTHETGGPERPRQSKYIAVPQGVKRSQTGRITKANRPSNLKNSFVLTRGNDRYIFRRVGRGRRSRIEFMYSLERQIQIKPTLQFVGNVSSTINKRYDYFVEKGVARELQRAGVKLSKGPI